MTLAFLLAALVALVGVVGFAFGPVVEDDIPTFIDRAVDFLIDCSCLMFELWDRFLVSRVGTTISAFVFAVALLFIGLPVGLYLRGLSALRKAVRA